MVTNKSVNKFLMYLYCLHTEKYGDSIRHLDKEGMHILDGVFSWRNPASIVGVGNDSAKDSTVELSKELEARGFVKIDGSVVILTPAGYEEAKRLSAPALHFVSKNWKWCVGTVLSFITILVAVIRLTNCPQL